MPIKTLTEEQHNNSATYFREVVTYNIKHFRLELSFEYEQMRLGSSLV
jgi:hypothetical protein